MWALKLQPVPKVNKKLIIDLAPVALFHTIAHVSACVSFSKMAVSFTHVIKVRRTPLLPPQPNPETHPLVVFACLLRPTARAR